MSARLAESVTSGMLNQDDPDTVAAGTPAYLILIDGMIQQSPRDAALLAAAARLNGTYAAAFAGDGERSKRLSLKAKLYGERALCAAQTDLCDAAALALDEFVVALEKLDTQHIPVAYAYASALAAWLQANHDDWGAIAQLPRLEVLLQRIASLDASYDHGGALVMLGVIATRLPESMGGKPEQGRRYFERAVAVSEGRNLMAKVRYAANYARLVFNRELHDRLLNEVLNADPVVPDLTLANILAQDEARKLLAGADNYF
jgi:hypothetical protein